MGLWQDGQKKAESSSLRPCIGVLDACPFRRASWIWRVGYHCGFRLGLRDSIEVMISIIPPIDRKL